jgi:FkbM family methyltransferase
MHCPPPADVTSRKDDRDGCSPDGHQDMSRPESDSGGPALEQDVSTTMLPFKVNDEHLEFECIKNRHSIHTARGILSGETYPLIPMVRQVDVVMDVGANCGSASTFFSVQYPGARILSFEPASVPYCVLERNARRRGNIEPFNFGLLDRDDEVPLYSGAATTGTSSVLRRPGTTDRTEPVKLRSTRAVLDEQGISKVDLLKIDTEGCEVPILDSMRALLPGVQVVYLEFHSERDRRLIDGLLADTHLLGVARVFFGQGEVAYVSRSLVDTNQGS